MYFGQWPSDVKKHNKYPFIAQPIQSIGIVNQLGFENIILRVGGGLNYCAG